MIRPRPRLVGGLKMLQHAAVVKQQIIMGIALLGRRFPLQRIEPRFAIGEVKTVGIEQRRATAVGADRPELSLPAGHS